MSLQEEIAKKSSEIYREAYQMSIEQHNNEAEIYMDNGWHVALEFNPMDIKQISNITLIGIPAS